MLDSDLVRRLFYLAIPPNVFIPSAMRLKKFTMSSSGWNRLVVEKPFGSDFASAAKMNADLMQYFSEEHIYRIDHYLGKEMVQNLSALRFANSIFEPVWNSRHIELVTITFKENIGTAGRGGYFDKYGIIRDVMQNHLIQILSLVAMEQPVSLHASDICDEKVKLLRCIAPIELENLVIGQFVGNSSGVPGYREDDGVPKDSITPTFAMAALFVNNSRWDGTPFVLKCGKGLNDSKAEIRIQFRRPPGDLYQSAGAAPNELVLRVQPNEAIYLKLMTKEPGLQEESKLHPTELDLTYKKRFEKIVGGLPDAYERLILDVIRGDHSLFVRDDELLAAWSIFTPVLHQLEQQHTSPIPYEFGTRGPKEADELAFKMGFHRNPAYQYKVIQ
jgi:glucose-6-phosphate 1-dehydrogenase